MRHVVGFHNQTLALELNSEQYLGTWQGPESLCAGALDAAIRAAVDSPLEAPPLVQSVVAGDRVTIAVDLSVPDWDALVDYAVTALRAAAVRTEDIVILAHDAAASTAHGESVAGIPVQIHDPTERAGLAYLASTSRDRRIYLNRALVDADFVLPIARITYSTDGRVHGPWSLIFPALSDQPTQADLRKRSQPSRRGSRLGGDEATEVCWLLGNLFQIGVVEGHQGIARVIGGLAPAVQKAGMESLRSSWWFRADERVDLVVAGIGPQGRLTRWDDLHAALETASRVVKAEGCVVLVSDLNEQPGPALEVLASSRSPEEARDRLQDLREAQDEPLARDLLSLGAHLRLFCMGEWKSELVEDLGMIPVENSAQIERLARSCGTTLVLSHADQMRVELVDDGA